MGNQDESNKPEKTFRAGGVSATVWKNKGKKDGNEYEYFTVTLKRSYKDGDDWKETDSLRVNDLPKATLVLNKAFELISLKDETD